MIANPTTSLPTPCLAEGVASQASKNTTDISWRCQDTSVVRPQIQHWPGMACSFCFPYGRLAVIELAPAFANGSLEKKIYSISRRRDGIGDK